MKYADVIVDISLEALDQMCIRDRACIQRFGSGEGL